MFESLGSWVAVFMGIVALFVLWNDLKMRRKIMESELRLQEGKFKQDELERTDWQQWLERERIELSKMYGPLSSLISSDLIANNTWAIEAIEKAKLGSYSQTLFGDRSGHFYEEKKVIASRFVPLLLSRCKHLIEERGKKVYLIVDSGTTLKPLFKLIGSSTVQASENKEQWIKKLSIFTNNLPGVQSLMENGRPHPKNRYSGLAIDCHLLPGVPLPVYSAVTGQETEEALFNLRKLSEQTKDAIFIGISTGNWIRIRKTPKRCPVPLGRGEGHLTFKQAVLDVSDEMFVISPLGKIFANASNKAVNRLLKLSTQAIDPERKAYDELEVDDNKAGTIKLVTTSRKENRLLQSLSIYLLGQMDLNERIDDKKFVTDDIGKTADIAFMCDDLPNEDYLERNTEFPHIHTRNDEFIDAFLHPEKELSDPEEEPS